MIETREVKATPKVGIVYGDKQFAASRNKVCAFLALLLVGGGIALGKHMMRDPLALRPDEINVASQALGALKKALKENAERIQKDTKDRDALPIIKKEHEVQAAQRKLMEPIEGQIKTQTDAFNKQIEPMNKQLEPMNTAIKESDRRIVEDPTVKAKNDDINKLTDEIRGQAPLPARNVYLSIHNAYRDARGLPAGCTLDEDMFDVWYKTDPNGNYVAKDGKPAQSSGDRVQCTVPK